MVFDPFGRASRFLLRQHLGLLAWLLGLPGDGADFVQWLDTRRLAWPGAPERVCDTVAHLRDGSGAPWAVVVEFQGEPDPDVADRLLAYLGQVMLDLRPTPLPGDRFCVGAVVVNLTGRGQGGRDMDWPQAGLRTLLRPACSTRWRRGRRRGRSCSCRGGR